jgi:hypothetical protein
MNLVLISSFNSNTFGHNSSNKTKEFSSSVKFFTTTFGMDFSFIQVDRPPNTSESSFEPKYFTIDDLVLVFMCCYPEMRNKDRQASKYILEYYEKILNLICQEFSCETLKSATLICHSRDILINNFISIIPSKIEDYNLYGFSHDVGVFNNFSVPKINEIENYTQLKVAIDSELEAGTLTNIKDDE